ncbi:MAG: hypothetical protein JST10_11050, partial [Bacteroidetes bacterium]|nr:hypothetical protein [Bacteroidota bacterium]
RWGPIIKFGKKIVKIPKKTADDKYTKEELAALSLEDVKNMIEAELPDAFGKKAKAEKKTVEKKAPAKKKAKK